MKDLHYIKFLDHAIGMKYLTCEVVGWILEETEEAYKLSWWIPDLEGESFEANIEPFWILKSTIKEIYTIAIH